MKKYDAIAVIDFGGQYAHLIANKVRRLSVLAEIKQPEDSVEELAGYKGIILSGSPALTSQGDEPGLNRAILGVDVPILGLCFGHQEIAHHYGGEIAFHGREWGHANFHKSVDHPLFEGLNPVEQVWMSHNDSVVKVGEGFEEFGYTTLEEGGKKHGYAAIGSDIHKRYGVQFHPEVDDTPNGDVLISNFVKKICGCEPSWTMSSYLAGQVDRIREQVGEGSVFLLASGGVDSTVAAKLFAKAIGNERLHLLHIDNGLMRKDESKNVVEMYKALGLDTNFHFYDATEDFLTALGDEISPEEKRKIIGNTFVEVFDKKARELGIEDHLLGQGTIYPDTIETGATKRSDTIKTHHNRVPVIDELIKQGKVIEPLADLYKVEVRELGEMLGIEKKAVWRHPFPGPGLGVRLLCSDGAAVDDLAEATAHSNKVASEYGLTALALPVKSVGVKADLRTYEHPVILNGETTFEKLQETAGRIFKEVPGINRCIWNLNDVAVTEAVPLAATMTKARLDMLREADALVMNGLRKHGLYDSIWQCPTVFIPLMINGVGSELCVVRPIHSERAMTATAASLPAELVLELREHVMNIQGVCGLALDLTSKPPGTIEWE
ncbi:MAG: glutamine-hydrolyzing GMP synthase [Deltaproteobacteria bacterium]|nr:glutamine-hydrolyzing GMP synthase [Deltaproteobacteria bacterium]MBN2674341.1 glutamine-hydrolyzing GMP synthase [Deltaproteobacteria bacterium]